MRKNHHPKSKHQSHTDTSVSVVPEAPERFQDQLESSFIPSYEDIQQRAYQIYQTKGGNDLENWLEAERQLKGEKFDDAKI